MCKHFIEIQNGKITKIKGKFKKSGWSICSECGIVKFKLKKKKEK